MSIRARSQRLRVPVDGDEAAAGRDGASDAACVAAAADGAVDENLARLGLEQGDDFIGHDRDVLQTRPSVFLLQAEPFQIFRDVFERRLGLLDVAFPTFFRPKFPPDWRRR